MDLKLEKIFRVLHRGLGRREITGVSNLIGGGTGLERERLQGTQTGLDTDHVLEEKEITGFSNWRRCSECCTVGLADVKLHGTQTRRFYIKQHISGWKEVNCRVLKPDFFDVPMDFRFGKV